MIPIAAQMGYYAAAAQVIPILMLVLLVGESRFFRADNDDDGFYLVFALAAMLLLLVGEVTALRVLGQGRDSFALWAFTTISLLYSLGFFFQSAVRSFLLDDKLRVSDKRRDGLNRLALVMTLTGALVTLIVLMPLNSS